MSEQRKPYQVKGIASEISNETIKAFQSWTPPTGGEVRAALQVAGWTGESFAKKIGVNSRTVRRWCEGSVDIPYTAWAVVLVEIGHGNIWNYD